MLAMWLQLAIVLSCAQSAQTSLSSRIVIYFCSEPRNQKLQEQIVKEFTTVQRELFYSILETLRVIIRLNSRYCCPYC